ncbi:protein kinase C-binding protein 1-like [Varroa jacobsoni]|uniref:protein kinase C-binding protein 1-like n=1 Tax=Varroa jacobsoni TaxID=62625 RepID=UPI000BFA64C2|nr:protein kinase C-binding protein 1-like [Varroa jacobsoni]XP_022697803.1 protein kinase C-binding protein 1-like [Varroa jacobsoni]XP_022697804.1 protein kinase C-binding protein 1-like [Varroa jacobsoni]
MPSSGATTIERASNSSSSPEKKSPPKAKRPRLSVTIEMPESNDRFCWKCHGEDANVPCTACQRSFHEYCVPPPSHQQHELQQVNSQSKAGERPIVIGSSNHPMTLTTSAGVTAASAKSNRNNEATDQLDDEQQDLHNFVCAECLSVILVERGRREGKQPRGSLDKLDKQQLSELLLVAVRSIRPYALEVFHAPVSLEEYPDYKDFVVKPFDLQQLEQLVTKQRYSCVEEFVSDLKWIHHNSVVYNGPQNRISSSAVAMLKAADKEVGEMSLCPQCYLHMRRATASQSQSASPASGTALSSSNGNFFSEVCSPPHIIVWAKIRGFPHWPAKVMRVEGDQVTVKFFGDHNKSLVTLGNCTILTQKPPVNQKSKKGSYSTAMDEMATYVRKYRERFGVDFRYETDQIKLTTEIYNQRMSAPPNGSQPLTVALGSQEASAKENELERKALEASSAVGYRLEATALTHAVPTHPAEAVPTEAINAVVKLRNSEETVAATGGAKDINYPSSQKCIAAAIVKANNMPTSVEPLPMDVDERDDDEDEEERRIKSVIISQVPLLADNDDDDKDSGSEEQNSILESIKRKLNLDKKSDSTDDDKEDNGNGKEIISATAAAATEAIATAANSSSNNSNGVNNISYATNSSASKDTNKADKGINNNLNDNNNTESNNPNGITLRIPDKDFKSDLHPDIQLQQMQATAVIAQNLGRHQSSSDNSSNNSNNSNRSSSNSHSNNSGSGNSAKNERKSQSAAEDSHEKPQREAKPIKAAKDQQQLKSDQYNCSVKEEKEGSTSSNSSGSSNGSGSVAKEHIDREKDGGRSALMNASGSSSRRESSRAHMNSNSYKTNVNSGDLNATNERQRSRTRVRGTRTGVAEQQDLEDLESPASPPPSAAPLVAGLVGGVEDASLLAAAAAIGLAGAAAAAAAATGQQQHQQGKGTRADAGAGGSSHFGANKGVLAGGVLGLGVTGLLAVEDTPKSPERTNCCAEVSSTTADTDPPQATHLANTNNQSTLTATTTVIPKVASGDTFFEKLRQTIEECKEKVGVTGHLSQLQPIAAGGGVIGTHPEDEDQEEEEGHDYDESETDVSDTELMPYQQKALQLPSPRKESTAPPTDEAALLSLASSQCFTHRETQTGDIPAHSLNWTSDDWALHYWNAPRVHPDDKRLNQELVAREMSLLKDKLKLKELAAHKALWQASATRMTDVVKSKQWCCVCKGLATMTCCWNTSYCSQACQSSHWPVHIKTCERSQQTSKR